MEDKMAKMSVADNVPLGMKPLADKKRNTDGGTPVQITTNVRGITIKKNTPIFKYSVQILYSYRRQDGTLATFEMSKSTKSGTEHDDDKDRCQRVYKKAVNKYDALKNGGPFFYDRQAALYSFTRLVDESIAFEVTEGVSRRRSFEKAEFILSKVDDSFQSTSNDIGKTVNQCPALADHTLHEALSIIVSAPAYSKEEVITVGNCVHYLCNPEALGRKIASKTFVEGSLYSGIGVTKSVKTLEGANKDDPSLFVTTELKVTLFHPDNWPLLAVFKTFRGFQDGLQANTPLGQKLQRAVGNLDVYLNYGSNAGLGSDAAVAKIRKFHTSSLDTRFETAEGETNVFDYFKKKYNITLKCPRLFTVEVKGKKGKKIHLPVEVLLLCSSQVVTNEQMVNLEQSEMIKLSASRPDVRKGLTEEAAKAVGLVSEEDNGIIKIGKPVDVQGIKLANPTIVFAGGKTANPGGKIPTDWSKPAGYYEAKALTNWEIVFVKGEDVPNVVKPLVEEMTNNGMKVTNPVTTYIVDRNLEKVFQNGKAANRQLLFFVTKSGYDFHQDIKKYEQKYDLLTQDIRAENALKLQNQWQTRLNVVNKTNMKLGGLNYRIQSDAFNQEGRLIVGFETSQRGGGNPDYPISVGFAANLLNNFQKFGGGYVYVNRSKDVFGPILKSTLVSILRTTAKNRGKPTAILLYFNGVSEGQYPLLNEVFRKHVDDACSFLDKDYKPQITIIASSKTHNERLYLKKAGNTVSNLEPGTVVDHTIVHPKYTQWFHAGAVARQGTAKTVKYTLINETNKKEPVSNIQNLTNALCFDHQIVFHPTSLPIPLALAGSNSQRGAKVLAANGGPIYTNGQVDLEKTNQEYGYGTKRLFSTTRFNA